MSYLKYYTPSATTRETYRAVRQSSLNFEAYGGERGVGEDTPSPCPMTGEPVTNEPITTVAAEVLHARRRHARHVPRRTPAVIRHAVVNGHHPVIGTPTV